MNPSHKPFRTLSIRTQLTLLVSAIIAVAFGLIIYTTYTRQVASFVEEYRDSAQTILDLESSNLDQYVRELRAFCVQPCLNLPVYNSLLKTGPLSSEEQDAIKQEIQSKYHSRTDLKSYALSVLGAGLRFERPLGGQHVLVYSAGDVRGSTAYLACGDNDKYEYLAPADNEAVFFRYYHYLIRVRDRSPISLSRVDVGTAELKLLLSNLRQSGEVLCLYNRQGELLYSSLPFLQDEEGQQQARELYLTARGQDTVRLQEERWFLTCKESSETGLLLLSLMPQSVLSGRARTFLNPMLGLAVLIILLLIAVITLALHLLTGPLMRLCAQMSRLGEGDFSPLPSPGGCRESDVLTESYNTMTQRVNELIQTNYVANLKEKNARLEALEAQLNPHFLYNTLQAIATEALVAGSPQVYDMIVSLSANLRYSIKGDQLVPLKEEMAYVQSYILLQKTRLRERLEVKTSLAEGTESLFLPKISIQLLVENAILHGIRPDGTPLHVQIFAALKRGCLVITVEDDGLGISKGRMEELNRQFSHSGRPLQETTSAIGLQNLMDRLRILYQGRATMTVDSVPDGGVCVTIRILSPETLPTLSKEK